eukprot:GHRQ01019216.1.p2 GENE.GHRQ01019216.1~~GHRQ01019216.1.p2  ORF type:complete len:102 (-),score=10.10 GHRQ01019216.1:468-773(-)
MPSSGPNSGAGSRPRNGLAALPTPGTALMAFLSMRKAVKPIAMPMPYFCAKPTAHLTAAYFRIAAYSVSNSALLTSSPSLKPLSSKIFLTSSAVGSLTLMP